MMKTHSKMCVPAVNPVSSAVVWRPVSALRTDLTQARRADEKRETLSNVLRAQPLF